MGIEEDMVKSENVVDLVIINTQHNLLSVVSELFRNINDLENCRRVAIGVFRILRPG